jgi:hypothetical protein
MRLSYSKGLLVCYGFMSLQEVDSDGFGSTATLGCEGFAIVVRAKPGKSSENHTARSGCATQGIRPRSPDSQSGHSPVVFICDSRSQVLIKVSISVRD